MLDKTEGILTKPYFQSKLFKPSTEFRIEFSVRPLVLVESKNVCYITDSTSAYKVVVDTAVGVCKPYTCKRFKNRTSKNVIIQEIKRENVIFL